MKRLIYLLTALLIVPNTASAKFINASVFDLATEQNFAHYILEPKSLADICLIENQTLNVVKVGHGYFGERTHVAIHAARELA